jgi:hypothetical protein
MGPYRCSRKELHDECITTPSCWQERTTSLIYSDLFAFVQRDAITAPKQLAMPVIATGVIVNAIAVADAKAVFGAIPPDRALHEPWKRLGEGSIELPGVDLAGDKAENVSAPARPIAPVAVRMASSEPGQDSGSVQEIMDQSIDSHERCADFEPQRPVLARAEQHRRQRHRQDLVGNAVHVAQWPDQSLSAGREPIRIVRVNYGQLPIGPADEIGIGNVPHEQKQAVRHLVEAAVP